MLFIIEVDQEWLQALEVLTETVLSGAASTPEEAAEKAIFTQIKRQYTPPEGGDTMSQQPEIVFRHGACSAAIFAKEVTRGEETFTIRTVSFQRRYRDANGDWQSTSTLGVNDIPKAILTLNKAFEYLTANNSWHREEEEID